MDKEEAKKEIAKLVKEFLEYPKEILNKKSEFQIQNEFIDPLFEALGWNMRKDAEREERVLKGRVDYILRIGNQDKLVIEAKATDIKLLEEEGRQAVSYAYHTGIKFAVLTNFRQIRVYHALSHIKNIDKNLLKDDKGYLIFDCEKFVEQFDRLWLLSKESLDKEEINKLLNNVDKRLIKPIDESVLTDLLEFRGWLSADLKSKRTYLTPSQIDEIVQILIDRLIFMRSVEDRGLEEEDFLLKKVKDVQQGRTDKNLWASLIILFKIFNKEYNSKLFFAGLLEKEGFFEEKTLIKVIRGLYYGTQDAQNRYRFDDIPIDLLGRIYEQYLGVVLRGTEKRVKLDLLSGKRKSMGIYYTPSYIVKYILKNTLGEYTKNKSIDEILDIKILDCACGSGSFLIEAFQELINIIEERLEKGEKSKSSQFSYFKKRLDLGQKSAILERCIYGVDLDEKAVELTQLNLLLKILEEETRETRKRILPFMKGNIRSGDSLVEDGQVSEKAFNWKAQFSNIFKEGGFDIVIGNPPYVNTKSLSKNYPKIKEYYVKTYKSASGSFDLYIPFIERAMGILKEDGYLSFIIPNKILSNDYAQNIRKILLEKTLVSILDVSHISVFKDASVYPIVFVEKNRNATKGNKIKMMTGLEDNGIFVDNEILLQQKTIAIQKDKDSHSILSKIEEGSNKLGEIAQLESGVTGFQAEEIKGLVTDNPNKQDKYVRFIVTKNIDPYIINFGNLSYMRSKFVNPFIRLDNTKITKNKIEMYQFYFLLFLYY